MNIKFWKMHGIGNDYIVVDNRNNDLKEEKLSVFAREKCQRRFSIGADGLLLLSDSKVGDVRMRIVNSDGSEAEMCGNGIRCLAKYCFEKGIVKKKRILVETLSGIINVGLDIEGKIVKNVYVDMGKPRFDRKDIPMKGYGRCINKELVIEGKEFRITCLSIGNPHCVIFVDDVEGFPVKYLGPKIENNDLFPQRVNVEFAEVINKAKIKMRVWERGVGETLACGTGACATVIAGNLLKLVENEVIVHLPGGDLMIEYKNDASLSGPAEKVFEGTTHLE